MALATMTLARDIGSDRGPAVTDGLEPILHIRLCGPLRAEDAAGRSLLPRTRKARAVLAVLALAAPRPVLRVQLTSLLWSQRQPDNARASLRQAIHELQDIFLLRGSRALRAERYHLALAGDGVRTDVAAATRGEPSGQAALACLAQPLLDDLTGLDPAFDAWLADERARLRTIARALGDGLIGATQNLRERLEVAETLIGIDPQNESAWRAAIRAHAERGDRDAALRMFDRCRAALAHAGLGEPSIETGELAARLREQDATTTATAAAAEPATRDRAGGAAIRIGIAPFRQIGSVATDELSLGLAEEITTALSRCRWISCISGTSWAALCGEKRHEAVWNALGLDFILDGTIQQNTSRVRITVRLMDMRAAGAVIWAQRFDRATDDLLAIQDEIAAAIVAQIDPALLIHEGERTAARQLHNPTAQELVLQALPPIYRLERRGFHEAGRTLEAVVAANPSAAVAHAWLAYWHLFLVGQGWASDPPAAAARAAALAERAVTLDPTDARALTLAGHVRSFLGKRPADGCALHERAITLNPNLALAWCFSGFAHCYLGHHEEALRRMYQAVRLSPSDPHLFFFDHALIMPYLLLGEYETAAEIGRRAVELNPWFSSAYKGYVAALGHLDRGRETETALRRLMELEPAFTVESAIARSPMARPDDLARYAEGLRRAGLPERQAARLVTETH